MVPSHKTVSQYHNQDADINSQDMEHFNQHKDSSGLHLWTYYLLPPPNPSYPGNP